MKRMLLISLILIAGCSKEINTTTAVSVSDNTVSDATAATNTYLPLTTGTNWYYTNKTGSVTEESKLTVLNLKKTFNGKAYTAVNTVKDGKKDTIYYNQTAHNYYIYTNEETGESDAVKLEILFLNDNLDAGKTWRQSAGTASGVKLNCYGKIVQKNMTLTVNGETYGNVIHSYVEIRKPFLFTYIVVYTQDYYVAKNIGIIKNISRQVLPSGSATTTGITSYSIK
ncbi:hypothetical protein [Parafilimonas sp.]|uniref:hypothetical protein n=1 Tax=Parafilimonas sp. TaxID=1969739 RepID=UPI0039E369BC